MPRMLSLPIILAHGAADPERIANGHGPEGGPLYVETDPGRLIVEPFNAVTAAIFLGIVVYWAWRLRGRCREYLFLAAALPILAVGGIGGTVYHATRSHRAWLFMDWMPIAVLCVAAAVYLWSRLLTRWWYALGLVPAVFGIQTLIWNTLRDQRTVAIALTYSVMAGLILAPAVLVLRRERFRDGRLLLGAFLCFVVAITSRQVDPWSGDLLPMGSHFLWHVFGAAATHLAFLYLYRLRMHDLAEAHDRPGEAAPEAA